MTTKATTTSTPSTSPSTTATLPGTDVTVPLTASDRCDRCLSQAYVRATLPDGGELLFCGHHANEHRAALVVAGAAIHDETDRLTTARTSGFGG